jgi:hypothetical protein
MDFRVGIECKDNLAKIICIYIGTQDKPPSFSLVWIKMPWSSSLDFMLTPQNLRMPIALFPIFEPNRLLPVDLECHEHLCSIATHPL